MVDTPERIWVYPTRLWDGWDKGGTAYVRADLHEQVKQENVRLQNLVDIAEDRLRTLRQEKEAASPVKEITQMVDDQIMEIINEVAPWKEEPKLNDLLTYEKSVPLFPQATYDVPSYRATKFVRAVEQTIQKSLNEALHKGDQT